MDRTSDLAVDSVTGVDVALPVAGPGARSFAFLIDWLIRTILSVAWYVVAALLHNGDWSLVAPLVPDANWFVLVVAPPGAIYFFYHPGWEVVTNFGATDVRLSGGEVLLSSGPVHAAGRDDGLARAARLTHTSMKPVGTAAPWAYRAP